MRIVGKVTNLMLSLLAVYAVCASLHGLAGAIAACNKVDDCSCKIDTPKGSQEINIRSLGNEDGKNPRFGFKNVPGTPWEYAYNPCYVFSDGTSDCKDVVACQRSQEHHDQTFGIGDVAATWKNDGKDYYIEYSHTSKSVPVAKRLSQVFLKCDATAKEPILDINGGTTNVYKFLLTTECACPGTCKSPPSGLGVGSVICIIFSVIVVVYLVGGVLFMKFVRHAEGRDIVPNYELWSGVPGNIKDGFVFVFNCGRAGNYEAK